MINLRILIDANAPNILADKFYNFSFWSCIKNEKVNPVLFGKCVFWLTNSLKRKSLECQPLIIANGSSDNLLESIPTTIEELAEKTPLVFWDERQNRLMCFSHPFGKGTFFYTYLDEKLIISTSLQDLAPILNKLELNPSMVAEYFVLIRNTNCDQTLTFIKGINQIPPGHILEWKDGHITIKPYWFPQKEPMVEKLSLFESAKYVRETLEKTIIKTNLDSKIGCLVSGGLDSSVVAATVQRQMKSIGNEVVLLTLRHEIDCIEEHKLQQLLAKHLQTPLVTLPLTIPRLQLEPLRALNRLSDSPSGGLFTGIYMEIIERAAEIGISVLFGGEGGDEVFSSNPHLIADLIIDNQWKNAIQALGFFSSFDGDKNSLKILSDNNILSLFLLNQFKGNASIESLIKFKIKQNVLNTSNLIFLKNFFGDFSVHLKLAYNSYIEDLISKNENGFSFATYDNYRRVIEIPFYEACWPYYECGAGARTQIINPIADISVFKSAMTLRLNERAGTWVGFRPKRLLRLAAENDIPPEMGFYPKIGVSNLVVEMTKGMENELIELLLSSGVKEIGINPPLDLLDPRNVPTKFSLYWALLLTLSIWFDELKKSVAEKRHA